MSEELIAGGAIALVSFALATAYGEYGRARDRRQRDRAVLTAISEEVSANLQSAENTLSLVQDELKLLDDGRRSLNPLDPLETGFWELVKLDPPQGLLRDTAALADVRKVARLTSQINTMLDSRERFRATIPSMAALRDASGQSPAIEMLRGYDKLIETWLLQLIVALDRVKPAIAAWRRHT